MVVAGMNQLKRNRTKINERNTKLRTSMRATSYLFVKIMVFNSIVPSF